jgi:hypothetical protein
VHPAHTRALPANEKLLPGALQDTVSGKPVAATAQ